MKRNFYRFLHILVAVLIGLDLFNINRTFSILGSIALIVSAFITDEKHSGLTVRYNIMQEFSILSGMLLLGALLFRKVHLLLFAAVFLIALFLEWKFRVFSSRWEES